MTKRSSARSILLALSLAVGAAVATGCAAGAHHDDSLPSYTRITNELVMSDVPVDGTYGLFSSSTDQQQPRASFSASKGDRIGFRRSEDGKIIAVAGPHEVAINPSKYVPGFSWQLQSEGSSSGNDQQSSTMKNPPAPMRAADSAMPSSVMPGSAAPMKDAAPAGSTSDPR